MKSEVEYKIKFQMEYQMKSEVEYSKWNTDPRGLTMKLYVKYHFEWQFTRLLHTRAHMENSLAPLLAPITL